MRTRISPSRGPLDGRSAALQAVSDALGGRGFVTDTLRALRATGRLEDREAGLAMEIGQGTMRHLLTIKRLLAAVASVAARRTPPIVRAILYTAAYQMVWMDRIPIFAAVDQAVELTRRAAGGRAPAMVNAVLRRLSGAVVQRRGPWQRLDTYQIRVDWASACHFNCPVLPSPENLVAHLAAATGERAKRYTELVARWGAEAAEAVAWVWQATPPTVLQVNRLRTTPEQLREEATRQLGNACEWAGAAAFVPGGVNVIDTRLFSDGLVYVQDTTGQAAALTVGARPGERVLDLCAAPGGKSVALALEMHDRGLVLACDTASARLAHVSENARRLGLKCIQTQLLSADGALPTGIGPFDAAIVDAPCSNTGVIARRPEARLGLTRTKLTSLVKVQRELLRRAAQHIRPGGRLVYSTCSVEPMENEQVVADFLADRSDWQLDVQQTILPAWGPRLCDWRDGGYFARLLRTRS